MGGIKNLSGGGGAGGGVTGWRGGGAWEVAGRGRWMDRRTGPNQSAPFWWGVGGFVGEGGGGSWSK